MPSTGCPSRDHGPGTKCSATSVTDGAERSKQSPSSCSTATPSSSTTPSPNSTSAKSPRTTGAKRSPRRADRSQRASTASPTSCSTATPVSKSSLDAGWPTPPAPDATSTGTPPCDPSSGSGTRPSPASTPAVSSGSTRPTGYPRSCSSWGPALTGPARNSSTASSSASHQRSTTARRAVRPRLPPPLPGDRPTVKRRPQHETLVIEHPSNICCRPGMSPGVGAPRLTCGFCSWASAKIRPFRPDNAEVPGSIPGSPTTKPLVRWVMRAVDDVRAYGSIEHP